MVNVASQNGGKADGFPCACVIRLIFAITTGMAGADSSFPACGEGLLELAGVRQ